MSRVGFNGKGITELAAFNGRGKIEKATEQEVREMATALKTDEEGVRRMIDSLSNGNSSKKGLAKNALRTKYSQEVQDLIDNFPEDDGGRDGRTTRMGGGRGGSNVTWQAAIDRAVIEGDLNKANSLVRQARRQGIRVITPEQRIRLAEAEIKLQKKIDAAVTEKTAELEDIQRQIYLTTGELREIKRTIRIDNEYRQITLTADGKVEVKRFDDPLRGKAAMAAEQLLAQQAQAALLGQEPRPLSKIVESGGRYLRVTVDAQGNIKQENVKKLEAKIEMAVEELALKQLEHFQRTGEMKSFKKKIKVGSKRFEVTLTADGQVKVKQKKTFFQKMMGFIGKFLLPALTVATMLIPGLQPIAGVLKIVGAIKSGIESIVNKNWMGLAGSVLGAFSGNLANVLQKGFSVLQTGYNIAKNGIKNVWDGVGAIAGAVSNIAGGAVGKIADYLSQGVGVIGSFVRGDIAGGLLGIGNLVGGEVKSSRLDDSWNKFRNGEQLSNARLNELKLVRGLSDTDINNYRQRTAEITQQTSQLSLAQITQFARELGITNGSQGTNANGTPIPTRQNNAVIELMRQNAARRGLTPEQTEIYIAQGLKLAQETRDKSTTQLALEAAERRNLTPEQTLEYLKQGERLSREIATKSPTILAFEAAERRGMNAEQTIAYIRQGEQLAQETKNLIYTNAAAGQNGNFVIDNSIRLNNFNGNQSHINPLQVFSTPDVIVAGPGAPSLSDMAQVNNGLQPGARFGSMNFNGRDFAANYAAKRRLSPVNSPHGDEGYGTAFVWTLRPTGPFDRFQDEAIRKSLSVNKIDNIDGKNYTVEGRVLEAANGQYKVEYRYTLIDQARINSVLQEGRTQNAGKIGNGDNAFNFYHPQQAQEYLQRLNDEAIRTQGKAVWEIKPAAYDMKGFENLPSGDGRPRQLMPMGPTITSGVVISASHTLHEIWLNGRQVGAFNAHQKGVGLYKSVTDWNQDHNRRLYQARPTNLAQLMSISDAIYDKYRGTGFGDPWICQDIASFIEQQTGRNPNGFMTHAYNPRDSFDNTRVGASNLQIEAYKAVGRKLLPALGSTPVTELDPRLQRQERQRLILELYYGR